MDLREERKRALEVMKRVLAKRKRRELEKSVYRGDYETNGVENREGEFDNITGLEKPYSPEEPYRRK